MSEGARGGETPGDSPSVGLSLKQFLETMPPGKSAAIVGARGHHYPLNRGAVPTFNLCAVDIYCSNTKSGREMEFDPDPAQIFFSAGLKHRYEFVEYTCRHCGQTTKVYALSFTLMDKDGVEITKIGEYPSFGRQLPAKLLQLFGNDADLLKNGQTCEAQGLGIGAFAYYRRAVENQKNALLDAFISAAKEIHSSEAIVADLQVAKGIREFSASIDSIKAGFPDQLKLNGENPLKLLHGAISADLHAASDEECLQTAIHVRVVLTGIADELSQLTRDKTALRRSVEALAQRRK